MVKRLASIWLWVACPRLLAAAVAIGAPLAVVSPARAENAPGLPERADLIDETLDNGLRVIVAPHPTPPGRVVVRLLVHAGSLDERDDQRGVAHFVQHMAFQGSESFPDDSVRAMFQSLGMELGKHEMAYATFDHTAYALNLPNSESSLEKGMTFLSDVLSGLTFPDVALETERSVILEEARQVDSPEQRVFQELLPKLTPGSRIGSRFPMGEVDAIRSVTKQDCLEFYRAWYTPSNATLIVAGDITAEKARGVVAQAFAKIPARATPQRADVGLRPFTQSLTIVATDPELPRGSVAVVSTGPAPAPATSMDHFRDRLVDQLMRLLAARRFEVRSFSGDAAYAGSGAYAGQAFAGMWIAQLVVFGPAEQWPAMLADLVLEIERARRYGFSGAELELVRHEMLTEARAFAQSEPTMSSDSLARLLADSVVRKAPLLSGRQNVQLLEKLLPSVTPEDVSDRFRATFDLESMALCLEIPDAVNAPTEAALATAAKAHQGARVDPPAEPIIVTTLMEDRPAPRGLAAVELDSATGVLTMRFDSGAVVRHRRMDEGAGRVIVRLTLAGGEIEEDASERGLTRASASFFSRPALTGIDGLSMRDFLNSRGVEVWATVTLDAVTLAAEVTPDQLETLFQLLHRALTDPVIEPAAIHAWREHETTRAVRRTTQPRAMLEAALVDAIYPESESRVRPLSADQAQRVIAERAQEWLRSLGERASIELSVVGDVTRTHAADLAARYFGSLPSRPVIHSANLAELRRVARAAPPHVRTIQLDTQADQAVVAVGFLGPDASAREDVRALDVAERIVHSQLVQKLRDEQGLVYSLQVMNKPAQALPGFGLFLVVAPTSPDQAAHVADLIERELSYFAEGGPGQSDVAIAQTQLAASAAEVAGDALHWSARLADLSYRGRTLGEIAGEAAAHSAIDPEKVREVMARHCTPDNLIRIIISPSDAPD